MGRQPIHRRNRAKEYHVLHWILLGIFLTVARPELLRGHGPRLANTPWSVLPCHQVLAPLGVNAQLDDRLARSGRVIPWSNRRADPYSEVVRPTRGFRRSGFRQSVAGLTVQPVPAAQPPWVTASSSAQRRLAIYRPLIPVVKAKFLRGPGRIGRGQVALDRCLRLLDHRLRGGSRSGRVTRHSGSLPGGCRVERSSVGAGFRVGAACGGPIVELGPRGVGSSGPAMSGA